MTMRARIASSDRSVKTATILLGGAQRRITRVVGYFSGQARALATFTQPLTLAVTPFVSGEIRFYSGPRYVSTNPATATPSGGLPPFTYAWSGGDTPTLAATSFGMVVSDGDTVDQTFSVTVTDAAGSTASGSVLARFTNYGSNP